MVWWMIRDVIVSLAVRTVQLKEVMYREHLTYLYPSYRYGYQVSVGVQVCHQLVASHGTGTSRQATAA